MRHNVPRAGSLQTGWVFFLASIVLFAGLIVVMRWNPNAAIGTGREVKPLVVYCAAGLKGPVEAAAREFEGLYGVPIQLQFGGSQTLVANLELTKQGDLCVLADEYYLDLVRQKDLLDEQLPLAEQTPVLAVSKGNPKQIQTLQDLLDRPVRLSLANPEAAAIGKLTRDALMATGQWAPIEKKATVFKPTVNDVANDVKVGAVDAGIVWDATVAQYPELEAIRLPELAGKSAQVAVGVLRFTTQPRRALLFARFLNSEHMGQKHFAKAGYRLPVGDEWDEEPELTLYAGAMLRPAIEDTVIAFERREGARIKRVYNGCGILVAQMKAGDRPDLYFACDRSFLDEVQAYFQAPHDVSTNRLVILVRKGNAQGVQSLKDLGKPGLKIGVGHEKQCALGALTQKTLQEAGHYPSVQKNVAVQLPTGDMLVNQLRTGSLDAVIAYLSNATAAADELDAFSIDGIPCALAVQPVAVAKKSRFPLLAQRLMNAFETKESQKRFESAGFYWGVQTK